MSQTDLSWLIARPVAHRGFHDMNKLRWENTLSAAQAAIDRSYAIECDVHLSADGVPIVFHDHALQRLTGEQGFIYEKTADEIRAMRIGGTADYPPTLADLLALVAGRVPLVIELKGTEGKDDGLVAKVAEQLQDYPGKTAIMSFDHWLIRQLASNAPGIPAGLTALGKEEAELEAHYSMLAHDIDFVSYHVKDLPNRFISFVRDRLGLPVISWTVRDEQAQAHSSAHVDQMTFEGFEA